MHIMEQNAQFGCGSGYGMQMQMNFTGVQVEVGGSAAAAAAAEARRRRKVVNKDKGFYRRKRKTFYRTDGFVPPPLPPNIIDQGRLMFLFFKKLQNSDVNNVGRTVLPKIPAETHLPRLSKNQSIILPFIDMDGVDAWSFKFRYWANNQSRMYVFEGTGEFTKKHKLQMGDYMLLYRDLANRNYVIRGAKACEVEGCANNEVTVLNVPDKVLPNETEVDPPENYTSFPNTEDILGTNFLNDNCYFSDILNSFSSWDNFMTNYPATQPSISFDNLSDEDLLQVQAC